MDDDTTNAFSSQLREKEKDVRNAIGRAIGNLLSPVATNIPDDFLSPVENVVSGAGNFINQNYDPVRVEEFPALELLRVYDREVPRNDWQCRWQAAAKECGDNNAAQILQKTGRMIALKSSDIWQALGDGAGGYDDSMGNAFAPFAFGSGMDTDEVSREDAVALGLMNDSDAAEPATIQSPEQIAERFAAKLRQYLAKLQDKSKSGEADE